MPNYFYTDSNGIKSPPLTAERLQVLVDRGTITPTTPFETDTGHKGLAGQILGLKFDATAPSPFTQTAQTAPSAGSLFCTNCENPVSEQVICTKCGTSITTASERAARKEAARNVLTAAERVQFNAAEQTEIEKFCTQHGTDVKAVDYSKETFLHKATKDGKLAVATFLISRDWTLIPKITKVTLRFILRSQRAIMKWFGYFLITVPMLTPSLRMAIQIKARLCFTKRHLEDRPTIHKWSNCSLKKEPT